MPFVKIYKTRVPNAAQTLDRRVAITPLLSIFESESTKASLSLIESHGELNFWDFGVNATPYLAVNDSVKIICRTTCYSGQVIQIVRDPTGELGDKLGWARLYDRPWKNVCALSITSSTPINTEEINTIARNGRRRASNFYAIAQPVRNPDALVEGGIVELTLSIFERNPANRQACLNHHGTRCQVCDLDFGEKYGALGQGFIHVHHITPLHQVREAHAVDPIKDLVPVCPNCHSMLHINQGEPLLVEQLREILAGNRA